MSIYCDDFEPPECSTEWWPKARKQHKCCECGSAIQPGTQYQRISGIWDGEPSRFKTCADCVERRFRYMRETESQCSPAFGYLRMAMEEAGVPWSEGGEA